ncbi:MAG: DUF3307 domain-containing protein [Bdellovibrionales bacterium]|nr:DUF3307 domain-containing protein [Bdellovibrionales bacterium]
MSLEGWTQLELTFLLLVYFQFKHFFADFPLQVEYMLHKTRAGWGFLLPLLVHCTVHALLTAVVVLILNPELWWLIILDFLTHFVMDRIKSGPRYLGRFNDKSKASFWNCLGLDQMVHHLTHIYIIWVIVTSGPV